jgi:hypothetical protein
MLAHIFVRSSVIDRLRGGPLGQPFQYDHLCARSFAVETCLPF